MSLSATYTGHILKFVIIKAKIIHETVEIICDNKYWTLRECFKLFIKFYINTLFSDLTFSNCLLFQWSSLFIVFLFLIDNQLLLLLLNFSLLV
jgi:hypothetical protein